MLSTKFREKVPVIACTALEPSDECDSTIYSPID
jgi:hypothetical protein